MRRPRTGAEPVAALALLLALAGCSAGPPAPPSITAGSASPGASVLPPVMADLASVDGTTVTVPLGEVVVLTGDAAHPTSWTATIADPEIVAFVPGRDDGSAQFHPGLTPLAEGTTGVVLDNAASGAHVRFTVEVTAKR
ncbi:hypothetical protein [uncultured Microbacterium sp.]|uniref:hypothetical protein n=1 Tax=uncultured Microbacterium sp. TaxID=191216 RepID=UPI0025D2A5EA|nr:hypothetical protein [uncultured Microbacterium sp.]